MSRNEAMLRYVTEQLDSLRERPEMWGPNICIELQHLMLMEMWLVAVRPELEHQNPRLVLEEYGAYCRRHGHGGNTPVSDKLREPSQLAKLLTSFREEFAQRLSPTNPFAEYDLTVAYNLKKEKALSESIVSQGLANVRRVLRAAARSPLSTSGRSPKQIEELADFEIVDVEIHPQNGAGARVVIPMRQQAPQQQDWSAQTQLREAIGAVVEMAEWAGGSTSAPNASNDPQKRDWIAWQTMRLLPGSDVETMELGGKLVSRSQPVTLRLSQRARLFSVLERGLNSSSYKSTGTIRALNRDTSVLRFRPDSDSKTLECWLTSSDDLSLAERNLCSKVEMKGKLFTGVARKPVLVVEEMATLDEVLDSED